LDNNKAKGKAFALFKKEKYKKSINEKTDLIEFNLENKYLISIKFNSFNHFDLVKWNRK
jgi:hypothetical protein